MKMSIDELAENAKRIAAGETIVELDQEPVDPSPVRDRIDDDDEKIRALFPRWRKGGPVSIRRYSFGQISREAGATSSSLGIVERGRRKN